MLKKTISIISTLILVTVVALLLPMPALAVPQPPHVLRGAVTVGGQAAPDGVAVTAAIAGASFPYTPTAQTSGGRYGDDLQFRVPADDADTSTKEGGVNGDTVVLYVQGVQAGTYTFAVGSVTELDLSISALPTLTKPTSIQRTTPDTDNTPTFTWSKVTNAVSYQVRIDTAAFADIGDVSTCTLTTVADGSHFFEVRGVDVLGNPGPSGDLYAFTIDTTPPGVSITALSPDPTSDNTPTLTGTAIDTATAIASVEYRVDGGSWTAATAADGAFDEVSEDYTLTTSALTDGPHTLEVRATDATSYVTAAVNYASDTFTVDTVPPTVAITALSPDPTSDSSPTLTGIATDVTTTIASVEYRVDGGSWTAATAVDGAFDEASEDYTFTIPRLDDGSYTIEVRATDAASNATTAANYASDSFTVTTEEEEEAAGGGGGGGGGGGPRPGETYVSDYVTIEGEFTATVTAKSEDGKVQLTIDKGVVGKTETGRRLSKITITEVEVPAVPPADSTIIGLTYDIGPDGATFEPPAILTFKYDTDELPEGVNEEDLVIAMWDEGAGEWVVLEGCTVNTARHAVSAPVSHLTVFTVLAYTRPAAFTTGDLVISPAEVETGESVTISVLVTNTGDLAGSYEVTLKIDNVAVATEDIDLAGGASQQVTFTIAKDVAGTYTVDINGLSGILTVKAAPAPAPAPAAFSTSALTISPTEVDMGENVTISVLVTNTGDLAGSYEVTLKIDNVAVATEDIDLAGGASQTVTFTTAKDVAGTYTVDINGLSGILTVKAAPSPATFATSALSISPTDVEIGESVTISVVVTNTGDLAGSYEVTLKIDNVAVATQDIDLAGGASQTVTFITAEDVAGTYIVNVNALSGVFTVKTPSPIPTPPPTPINWGLIGGIIAAVIVIGVVILLLIRRRTA